VNGFSTCLNFLVSSAFEASAASSSPMYASFSPINRGLHSSTFQLNLSALYGIGGAHRGCVAHVKGGVGGVEGV